MTRAPKVSQTQLAKELGVSQALVSLVLNGRKSGISPDTYDRIWQHAVSRGYHPKGMHLAASPASAQTRQVGVILRAPLRLHTLSNYFSHVQHGLHTTLEAKGYTTTFLGAEDQLAVDKLHRLFHPGHAFQGVVIMGEVTRPFLNELRKVERRLVAVSARYPGQCHSVVGNEPNALESLVQHLKDFGHERIGWIGGNIGLGRHEDRFSAFKAALKGADLAFNERYAVLLREADRAEGAEAVHMLMPQARRKDFPTAFICYNSLMAAGATKAFAREGWKVPNDVSLAGADTPRSDSMDTPRITGAGTSPDKLGEAAARLVLGSTGGEDESFTDIMLPSQLHIGESTGPAPG